MQGYPVLWSLAVEEQYYLVWPAVVRKLEPVQLLACSLAIVALTPVSRVISMYVMARHGYVSYWFNNYTWNSLDGLACGAALALAIRIFRWNRRRLLKISATVLVVSFATWCLGIPFGILARKGNYLGAALQVTPINVGFTGLLTLFLLVGTSRWKSLVLARPLRYLGYISYGLYLIQWLRLPDARMGAQTRRSRGQVAHALHPIRCGVSCCGGAGACVAQVFRRSLPAIEESGQD